MNMSKIGRDSIMSGTYIDVLTLNSHLVHISKEFAVLFVKEQSAL